MQDESPRRVKSSRSYRARPVIVEAVQLNDGNAYALADWVSNGGGEATAYGPDGLAIDTPEGRMVIGPGDWAVRDSRGEFRAAGREAFAAAYRPAAEDDHDGGRAVSTETVQAGTAQLPAELLESMRQRERAATPGPWKLETERCDCSDSCPHGRCPTGFVLPEPHTTPAPGEKPRPWDFSYSEVVEFTLADAEFIEGAREYVPVLLKLADALLRPHEPVTVYATADCCGCERPAEDSDEFDEWDADHSYGNDQGGETGELICYRTPLYQACPACTRLAYESAGSESWISAADCLVRPVAEKVLAGTGDAS